MWSKHSHDSRHGGEDQASVQIIPFRGYGGHNLHNDSITVRQVTQAVSQAVCARSQKYCTALH